ncbi:MAG: ferritin family protein [Clostridiales bacterium]|nr:ferritin family protein [Clostridiales bacterium]
MNDWKFAVDMELDGEKYYRKQAELNMGKGLSSVCLMLAEDEKRHAGIISAKMAGEEAGLTDSTVLGKAAGIFKGLSDIKSELRETPDQLEFYRTAMGLEKKSVELYSGYLPQAVDDVETAILKFLIQEEQQHYETIEELVRLLGHAVEWVESAEFGIWKSRGEY